MKLAFIGLGAMGRPIARRLALRPDLELSLYDTRREVLDAEAGLGRLASSVADAISDAQVIFSVLPADPHVRSVAEQIAEAATAGQIFVDFSTIAPTTIQEVGDRLEAVRVQTLGGALTRSVAAAETGELTIFIGGPAQLVERIRPALEQMASEIRIVETAAAAKALKVLNNMVVSGLDLVISDGLLVGARNGVDPHDLVDALTRAGGDSWPLRNHIAKHLLTDDLAPGRFSTRYMGKDAALAAQLAQDRGEPAWFAGLVSAAYRGTESLGFGDHYHPIVMRWFEHAANSGPITPSASIGTAAASAEAEAARDTLCRGIVAQQALITLDALRLVSREGVGLDEAVEHFNSGSASNDCLRALRAPSPTGAAAMTLDTLVRDLAAVCELAARVSVPAITFEVGKHMALSLVNRHGKDTRVADASRQEYSGML